MPVTPDTAICTWFVADDAATGTFFPQIQARSDSVQSQAIYWRCTACFYASSIAVNPGRRHVFYTNIAVPHVDGHDVGAMLERWGVEIVTLPITYRLPSGSVETWGNQFYIFDVLRHFAQCGGSSRLIVLDSDCIWVRPVARMEDAIDTFGALTYELDDEEHPQGEAINGLSREGMARFLAANGGPQSSSTPYFGGEIFAGTHQQVASLVDALGPIWEQVMAQAPDAPREEAHLLSILYALAVYERGTANRFIRRMWTTFKHNNLTQRDRDLTIWHLPAEKKTGFRELFAQLASTPGDPARDAASMGLTIENYCRTMGFPRRRPAKLVRDLSVKIREKIAR